MNPLRLCAFALIFALASVCMATTQIPGTFLVKSKGAWSLVGDHLDGWAVIIENDDAKTKRIIRTEKLMPEEEFQKYYTTAGPRWGDYSLRYITRLGDREVFRVRTRYETDILIDLEAATPISAKDWQVRLKELDKADIRAVLKQAGKTMKSHYR